MRHLSFYSLIFALFVTVVACGNGEDAPAVAEADEAAVDDVRTIEIIGTDDMRFVVAEEQDGLVIGEQRGEEYELEQILASPGEEIRIVLYTRSDLPGPAMSHNLAILESGTDVGAFIDASVVAADNDYIAPDMEDQVLITTAMLAGGESDTIQFTVPDETGVYDYVCSFPGHYSMGMAGELVVE
jgi:azurin